MMHKKEMADIIERQADRIKELQEELRKREELRHTNADLTKRLQRAEGMVDYFLTLTLNRRF